MQVLSALTMYDLPSDDLPGEQCGVPDEFHVLQPQLLSRTLQLAGDRYFTGTDMNVYYDVEHPRWYKRPDWFLAVGVPRMYEGQDLRDSYVRWQEGQSPLVVVELLSKGTEHEDLGPFYRAIDRVDEPEVPQPLPRSTPLEKFKVYEEILQVPYYVTFSRRSKILRVFRLEDGRYREQVLRDAAPLCWIPELNLGLGIWQGLFGDTYQTWLRWCDRDGNWSLTDTEQAEKQKNDAELLLTQTILNLVKLGLPIAQVAEITGLSEEKIGTIVAGL